MGITRLIFQLLGKTPSDSDLVNRILNGTNKYSDNSFSILRWIPSGPGLLFYLSFLNLTIIALSDKSTEQREFSHLSSKAGIFRKSS